MADPKTMTEEDPEIEIIEEEEMEGEDLRDGSSDDEDDEDDRLEDDQREAQESGDDGDELNARQMRRKRQKQRQKETMKKTREENAALLRELLEAKQRLAALETRNIQTDAMTAEQRYNNALTQVQYAEAQLKEAFETGDGDKAIKAQRMREQAVHAAREADDLRKRLNNPQLQQNAPTLDARTQNYAQQWMTENPWFNPSGTDEDSVIARAIDEAWASEAQKKGINPSSEEYWDELDARVKRRLGNTQPADRQRKKSPPPVTGRGERTSRQTTTEKFYISAERKKALQDAGVWDNPEERDRYVKRFIAYDKANRSQ